MRGMAAKKDGDSVHLVLSTRSHNSLLFFTDHGKVYQLARAYNLPESKRADGGRFIANVLNFYEDSGNGEDHEEIRAIASYDPKSTDMENTFVVMVTRNGIIKRCRLSLFKNLKKSGKRALAFREGDDLIDAQLTDGTKDLLISSRSGRAVRFNENQIRPMGNTAAGVRAIRLRQEDDGTIDQVVSMAVACPEDELLVITEKGYGKRTPIGIGHNDDAQPAGTPEAAAMPEGVAMETGDAEDSVSDAAMDSGEAEERSAFRYRLTNRGTRGCISIKLRSGDHVVAALQVPPDCMQDILLLTKQGQAVRTPVSQIKLSGRATQGVIVMRMAKENDYVVNVSLVDQLSDEDMAANAAKTEDEARAAIEAAEFSSRQAEEQAAVEARLSEDSDEQAPDAADAPDTPDASDAAEGSDGGSEGQA